MIALKKLMDFCWKNDGINNDELQQHPQSRKNTPGKQAMVGGRHGGRMLLASCGSGGDMALNLCLGRGIHNKFGGRISLSIGRSNYCTFY